MYTEEQLISFGKYLLSDERKKRIVDAPVGAQTEDRFFDVYHADIENWKETQPNGICFNLSEALIRIEKGESVTNTLWPIGQNLSIRKKEGNPDYIVIRSFHYGPGEWIEMPWKPTIENLLDDHWTTVKTNA